MNYEKEIEELLKPLPHKLQVRFALDCALDVKHLMTPEAIQALDVTGKWLKGEATPAEVEAAAIAVAYNASYWAAVCATGAFYGTAYNASYAAYAAGNNRDKKIKEYYENLRSMILNMSELEKLVYNIEI